MARMLSDFEWRGGDPGSLAGTLALQGKAGQQMTEGLTGLGNVFKQYVADRSARETNMAVKDLMLTAPDERQDLIRQYDKDSWVDSATIFDTMSKMEQQERLATAESREAERFTLEKGELEKEKSTDEYLRNAYKLPEDVDPETILKVEAQKISNQQAQAEMSQMTREQALEDEMLSRYGFGSSGAATPAAAPVAAPSVAPGAIPVSDAVPAAGRPEAPVPQGTPSQGVTPSPGEVALREQSAAPAQPVPATPAETANFSDAKNHFGAATIMAKKKGGAFALASDEAWRSGISAVENSPLYQQLSANTKSNADVEDNIKTLKKALKEAGIPDEAAQEVVSDFVDEHTYTAIDYSSDSTAELTNVVQTYLPKTTDWDAMARNAEDAVAETGGEWDPQKGNQLVTLTENIYQTERELEAIADKYPSWSGTQRADFIKSAKERVGLDRLETAADGLRELELDYKKGTADRNKAHVDKAENYRQKDLEITGAVKINTHFGSETGEARKVVTQIKELIPYADTALVEAIVVRELYNDDGTLRTKDGKKVDIDITPHELMDVVSAEIRKRNKVTDDEYNPDAVLKVKEQLVGGKEKEIPQLVKTEQEAKERKEEQKRIKRLKGPQTRKSRRER